MPELDERPDLALVFLGVQVGREIVPAGGENPPELYPEDKFFLVACALQDGEFQPVYIEPLDGLDWPLSGIQPCRADG